MGNPSTWSGFIQLDPPLTPEQIEIIESYNEDNRLKCIPPVMEHGQYHSGLKVDPFFEGERLIWDECEDHCASTDAYVIYFIEKYFKPWGIVASGNLYLNRQYDWADNGMFICNNNNYVFLETFDTDDKIINYIKLINARKAKEYKKAWDNTQPTFKQLLQGFFSNMMLGTTLYTAEQLQWYFNKFKRSFKIKNLTPHEKEEWTKARKITTKLIKHFPSTDEEMMAARKLIDKHSNYLYKN